MTTPKYRYGDIPDPTINSARFALATVALQGLLGAFTPPQDAEAAAFLAVRYADAVLVRLEQKEPRA